MSYLLDTNIIFSIVRDTSNRLLSDLINPTSEKLFVSLASVAEVKSMAIQKQWGITKTEKLDAFLDEVALVEMTDILLNSYLEIDTFSQKANTRFKKYTFDTPRNMGKNDLWIAATAYLLNLTLITTDNDFLHLKDIFFPIQLLDIQTIQNFSRRS